MNFYLGIDFGTSGARAIAINSEQQIITQLDYPFKSLNNNFSTWQKALFSLLERLPSNVKQHLQGIAINGTSATVLLCDRQGNPLDDAILYNDGRGVNVLNKIREIAPKNHPVISPTSSLAKLFYWQEKSIYSQASYFLHQADWLAFQLSTQIEAAYGTALLIL